MKKIRRINAMGPVNLHKPRITIIDDVKIVEHYCIVCGIFHEGPTRQSCFDEWEKYRKNL